MHGAGNFERQLVKAPLPCILRDAAFVHQAQQVAVSADVVEAVVVNAGVAQVDRHQFHRACPSQFEKLALAGGIELKNGRADVETLRPFRPAAAGVPATHGKHGRALRRLPALFERVNLLSRKLKQPTHFARQRGRREIGTDFHCSGKVMVAPMVAVSKKEVSSEIRDLARPHRSRPLVGLAVILPEP